MAKKIRFPLIMKNGAEVRSLEELQENFDLESVLRYFADGRLKTWLTDRYYDEKAEAIGALSTDMSDLNARICTIFGVEYEQGADETDIELIQRRNEKLRILNEITADKDILDNVDLVAMDQDELFDILDESPEKVYLYGEKFEIPFGRKNIQYFGINKPLVILENGKKKFDYEEVGINFENTVFEEGADTKKYEFAFIGYEPESKTIIAKELKKGVAFELNDAIVQVIEATYVDKYSSVEFVRVRFINIETGAVRETSFNPIAVFNTVKVYKPDNNLIKTDNTIKSQKQNSIVFNLNRNQDSMPAEIKIHVDVLKSKKTIDYDEIREMQYSYNDGDLYYFMDLDSYEQVQISEDLLPDAFRFAKEEMICKVMFCENEIVGVAPPDHVELIVEQTLPWQNNEIPKPAVLETGAKIMVPNFVVEGEKVIIDTRTGEYVSRV